MAVLTANEQPTFDPGRRAAAGWSRLVCRALLFCTGMLALLCGHSARAETSREYQLKAVFLFNFIQFTDWPTNTFATSNAPIVIGIIGNNPFGDYLQQVVRGEIVNGHPVEIRQVRDVDEIPSCQVLFISRSEDRRLERILNAARGKPILTVTDIEGTVVRGAIIRLLMENNRIHLRVDQSAARQSHLELSSKLLRVADVIPEDKKPAEAKP